LNNLNGISLGPFSNYNTLSNNTASNNYNGIIFNGADNNELTSNMASANNNTGIRLDSSSDNNLIYNNYFENTDNVRDDGRNTGNVWNSTEMMTYTYNNNNYVNYTGNYYNNYANVSSNDIDADGIGDTPYEARDNYPLMFWPVTTVPSNQPPVADANGPYEVNENTSITFDASGSYDPDGSIVSYEWDLDDDGEFDDGTGVNVTNTWYDDYSGEVSVKVTDNESSTDIDTTTVTVYNVAPTVTVVGDVINENDSATVSGTISDPGILDTFDVVIDWGDGYNETFIYPAGSTGYSETHQYPDDDPTVTSSDIYVVNVTVIDDDGAEGNATTTVTVNNVAPTVTAVGDVINENDSATVSGTISDPGANDTFEVVIDWGDGYNNTFIYPAGSTVFSEIHQYLDDDPTGTSSDDYIVNVTVTDDDGGEGTATTTVTVNNVAPVIDTLDLPMDSVDISNTVNLSATFTDPGTLDVHTYVIDWGDGNESDTLPIGVRAVDANHTYAASGLYNVTFTVEDDDLGNDTEFQYVLVYDPASGSVDGKGSFNSPAGAYVVDPGLTGVATFDFNSKYKKGVLTGETVFELEGLNFYSVDHEWMMVAGHKATYKGNGTINGEGNYEFLISAIDAERTSSANTDMFRIKIWNTTTVIYDNNVGVGVDTGDYADPITPIPKGKIKIKP